MGKAAATFRATLESPEVDADNVAELVKEKVNASDMQIEEVAFGLKALKFLVVLPEDETDTDPYEEKVLSIEGVKDVKVEDVTLV